MSHNDLGPSRGGDSLPRMQETLLLCVATRPEGLLLEKRLGGTRGDVGGRPVALLRTGVGPVNAALAVARFAAVQPVRAVPV